MAIIELSEITVPTNKYYDRATGEEKTFHRKVGSIMQNTTNGSTFLLMDKFFNLSAVTSDPDKANVLLNIKPIAEEVPPEVKPKPASRKKKRVTQEQVEAQNKFHLPFDDDVNF